MARTDMLRRQHDLAMELVEQINASIRGYHGERDAYDISMKLAKLNGLLRIHFAQEDRSLYPAMVSSGSKEISSVASAFQQEMGGIAPAFNDYVARWAGSAAIAADFDRFRNESATLFAALASRIERENETLYPLADSINDNVVPAA